MPLWNDRYATQAEFNVLSADAMRISANGSDIADDMLFRANLGAAPLPPFPDVPGQYVPLSGRPNTIVHGTAPIAANILRISPITIDTAIEVDRIGVIVSAASAAGTALGYFALYARGSNGVPGALQADWSSYGSIDLTAGTGVMAITTPGLVIPAGSWGIGFAWTGTGSSPTLRTTTIVSNTVASANPDLTAISGWIAPAAGAIMPNPAVVSDATNGVSIFGRIA